MATKDMPLAYFNKDLLHVEVIECSIKSSKQLFVADYSIVKNFIGE